MSAVGRPHSIAVEHASAVDNESAEVIEPNEEQRRLARAMAGFGLLEYDIAVLLDISVPALRLNFQRDLDRGAAEGTAKVAQTLFHVATVEKNVSAVIFWMKARAGWSEKHEVRVATNPLAQLSDAELDRMIAELHAIGAAGDNDPSQHVATPIIDAKIASD